MIHDKYIIQESKKKTANNNSKNYSGKNLVSKGQSQRMNNSDIIHENKEIVNVNQNFGLNSRVLEDQTSKQRGKINKKRVEDDKQKENKEITFENCHKLEFDSFQSANKSENHKKKEHPFNKEKQEISLKIKKKYININNDKLEIENVKKEYLIVISHLIQKKMISIYLQE